MEFYTEEDRVTDRITSVELQANDFADENFLTKLMKALREETLYQLVIVELEGERTKGVVWQADRDD
jgi:hypothetical protein